MLKKTDLKAILTVKGRSGSPLKRYVNLIDALVDLYNAGCSIKQLEQMFHVSKKFIRLQLPRVDGFQFRGSGPREPAAVPSVERVVGILTKHGIRLEDLPGPKPAAKPKTKKRGA